MIFNTFAYYLLFLLPAAVLFRCSPPRWRAPLCGAFGAAFFVYFSFTSVGGAAGAACLGIFLWEAIFSRLYRPASKLCWVGVGLALAVLFAFKYWNFAISIVAQDPASHPWRWSHAFLPLGISFFTFEFIHYAVDRYRGRLDPGKPSEYFAFILFFPTMVAGPIKRYQDFLPALREPSTHTAQDWERGITRILVGLAKKFGIADVLTAFTVHLNAADIAAADRSILPVWILAYAFQIYLDFSAYSDIAIGSSRLFGIRVKENFDWPYLQSNIADFWQHWHQSLTRWLTDYVFIPLGGSRVAPPRAYLNVLATLLVSGVWHGAGWNFVVWGLWHGSLLCLHRAWRQWRPPDPNFPPSATARIASGVLTFTLVTLGWSYFIMDVSTANQFLKKLLFG